MAAPTAYYVDPSINGNSGSGTSGDPYGDLQYALDQVTRDSSNGDIFHIKAGTAESLSSGLDLSTYGTPSNVAPLQFRGYTSAAGDGGRFEIDCGGSNGLFSATNNSDIHLIDGEVHNAGSNKLLDGNSRWHLFNMELHDGTSTAELVELGGNAKVVGCYIHDTSTAGRLLEVSNDSFVYGNFFKSSRDDLVRCLSSSISVINNIIFCTDTGSTAIALASSVCNVCNNTCYNSTAGTQEGILSTHSNAHTNFIANNIVEGWSGTGGNGIEVANSGHYLFNNRFYNNTTNITASDGLMLEVDSVTLGASPFTDPSSNDFTIQDDETDIQGVAYPTNIGGAAITSSPTYLDIGAVQREEPAGGGSSANYYIGGM